MSFVEIIGSVTTKMNERRMYEKIIEVEETTHRIPVNVYLAIQLFNSENNDNRYE